MKPKKFKKLQIDFDPATNISAYELAEILKVKWDTEGMPAEDVLSVLDTLSPWARRHLKVTIMGIAIK